MKTKEFLNNYILVCAHGHPIFPDGSPLHHNFRLNRSNSATLASCEIFVRKIGTNCICAPYSARSWSVWEGLMDRYSSQHHLMAHICLFRVVGFLVTPVRGINLLRWSPNWQKTICLQISQLSTKWWPLRTSNSSRQSSFRKPHPRTCSTHPTLKITLIYNLRKRPHDLQIHSHKTNILDKNFITRTILALNHT